MIGQEYWFLLGLAGIVSLFAAVEDWKKTEVANWLTYSFIVIGLAYRAFYSNFVGDWMFFIYGFCGLGLMFLIGCILYYSKSMGGGDAKLLMGFGVILPYSNFVDIFVIGIGFILLLGIVGTIYSLIWSLFIVFNNKNFAKYFKKKLKLIFNKWSLIAVLITSLFVIFIIGSVIGVLFFIGMIVFGVLLSYLLVVDELMIVKVKPDDLIEGDWLYKDIKIGKRVIGKCVHGLSKKDINLLRKAKRNVLIKRGIPFAPVFLISLIVGIMVFFYFL